MKYQNMPFPEAVQLLARRGGVRLPENLPALRGGPRGEKERLLEANAAAAEIYARNLSSNQGKRAAHYLAKRGITEETIRDFSIGYALPSWDGLARTLKGKDFKEEVLVKAGLLVPRTKGGFVDRFRGRVLFPITDVQGKIVGFGGRILGEGEPKYLNSPETPLYNKSRILYGLSHAREALRTEGFGVLVEGYLDCISAHQAGFQNVVATSGTALTDGHIGLMRRFCDRWIVVFDGDAAGIRAAKRSLEMFLASGLFARGVLLPEKADPDSFIRTRGAEAFRKLIDGAESLMEFFVNRTIQEHATSTIEGKVAAVREIVPLLAQAKGKVEQAEYVALVAHRLGVKEEALWSEVQAAAGGGRSSSGPPKASSRPRPPARAEEVGLVRAMLTSAEAAALIRKEVPLEDLEDDDCRTVAARIYSLVDEGAAAEAGERLHFEEERLNRLVASWLIEPEAAGGGKETLREATECLARMRRRRADRESRILQDKIAEAEEKGNMELLHELLKIKQELRLRTE